MLQAGDTMYIDALTIAGLISAASFTLMPLLMGREFWRVSECNGVAEDQVRRQVGPADNRAVLASGCVDAA